MNPTATGFWEEDEMGFESIDKRNEARILGALDATPFLVDWRIGLNLSPYPNYEEARRAFWEKLSHWKDSQLLTTRP